MSARSVQSPPRGNTKRQADTDSRISTPRPTIASFNRERRASSPTGQPILRDSSSFVSHKSDDQNVHAFAEGKKLRYLKASHDKENMPTKPRRNASLPEELANMARDAQQENIEDESEIWAEYRRADLAPMEEVVEDDIAGDLIMLGSLTDEDTSDDTEEDALHWTTEDFEEDRPSEATRCLSNRNEKTPLAPYLTVDTEDEPEREDTIYELDIAGHFHDSFKKRIRTKGLPKDVIQKRDQALDASQEAINNWIQSFLSSPENFIVSDHDDTTSTNEEKTERKDAPDEDQVMLYHPDPVFITVIGMLPEAFFWVVAQPLAYYSGKAMNTLREKLSI